MKKMIVLFLVLGVFLVGVSAAVAYSIGCNYGHDNDGYSQEIHIDNDGYSIVIDNQEHLYNRWILFLLSRFKKCSY